MPRPNEHSPVARPALSRLIVESYLRWTGQKLVDPALPDSDIENQLRELNAVVVAHDTGADPVFIYGNRKALELFEMDCDRFTRLPSRLSAEPLHQSARQRLLDDVQKHGFSAAYSGIRVSSSGRRFRIENATIWNLLDAQGLHHGQAATFANCPPISD